MVRIIECKTPEELLTKRQEFLYRHQHVEKTNFPLKMLAVYQSPIVQVLSVPIGVGSVIMVTALLFTSVSPTAGVVLYLGYEGFCKAAKLIAFYFSGNNSKRSWEANRESTGVRVFICLEIGLGYVARKFPLSQVSFVKGAAIVGIVEGMKYFVIDEILKIASRYLFVLKPNAQREGINDEDDGAHDSDLQMNVHELDVPGAGIESDNDGEVSPSLLTDRQLAVQHLEMEDDDPVDPAVVADSVRTAEADAKRRAKNREPSAPLYPDLQSAPPVNSDPIPGGPNPNTAGDEHDLALPRDSQ